MSPLWENKNKKIKKKGKIVERTSRKLKQSIYQLAQTLSNIFFGPISQRLSVQMRSIEGTSPHISGRVFASMTVEASLVLPLFLIFFLCLGSMMEVFRLHAKVEMALWETGREACLYGVAVKGLVAKAGDERSLGGELAETVGNLALTQSYVKGRVEAYLGREYLDGAPLQYGREGLHYLGSELLTENDQIEMVVTYQVSPKWALDGFQTFWLCNHYYGRLWTGYDLQGNNGILYYLAENMEVYHLDRECSHLRLHPREILREELATAVNSKGQKYRPCTKCVMAGGMSCVWISPEGDCYHDRIDCPGLKRTVRVATWAEARKYRPCSRCGKRGED